MGSDRRVDRAYKLPHSQETIQEPTREICESGLLLFRQPLVLSLQHFNHLWQDEHQNQRVCEALTRLAEAHQRHTDGQTQKGRGTRHQLEQARQKQP